MRLRYQSSHSLAETRLPLEQEGPGILGGAGSCCEYASSVISVHAPERGNPSLGSPPRGKDTGVRLSLRRKRPGNPESIVLVAILGTVPVSVGGPKDPGLTVPRTTPQEAPRAVTSTHPRTAVIGSVIIVFMPTVCYPLPDIAYSVINTEPICFIALYLNWSFARPVTARVITPKKK